MLGIVQGIGTIIIKTYATPRSNVLDNDFFQTYTVIERRPANACHGFANGDRGQACAFPECHPTNARHAIGNDDGGQACTILVYSSC